ncbi:hypothetical protein [Paenibacillus sp. FSL H8-0034]|uniref:hypothetical protein n=1 Tax=Paenibacillus sp. FSL H8-0034 TaxID=2954671 RepID=UPI0030FD1D15
MKNIKTTGIGGEIHCQVCDREFIWQYNFVKELTLSMGHVKPRLTYKAMHLDHIDGVNVTVLEMLVHADCPYCGVTDESYAQVIKENLPYY